jgi:hypothetical protein
MVDKVCAPSNSALDEIVGRIISTGLVDAGGGTYIPSIVRVGVNAHHSIASVSMDTLADQRMQTSQQQVCHTRVTRGCDECDICVTRVCDGCDICVTATRQAVR